MVSVWPTTAFTGFSMSAVMPFVNKEKQIKSSICIMNEYLQWLTAWKAHRKCAEDPPVPLSVLIGPITRLQVTGNKASITHQIFQSPIHVQLIVRLSCPHPGMLSCLCCTIQCCPLTNQPWPLPAHPSV